ncbi:SDR family NAD(P)-dependent oxidoreductase [Rhodococcus sp. NPDC057014]|uniref:SDR family NAD(P)-dependent oxidoreductase n=1 Tax=Rhodococcus sp. NPDC057014 TaxID=3346000 RepID=UPI003635D592
MTGEFEGLGGIVTGAGSGIGKATALHLASLGANVLAVDISQSAVDELAAGAASLAGTITPMQADVTDPEQVRTYAEKADALYERLWFFHNNAGVEGVHQSIIDTDPAEWRAVMDVNLHSFFYGLKYVLPGLVRRGGGSVVLTGSLLSHKAAPNRADYTVSKHAVLGLTRSAASEVAKDKVRVNCVCPGPIETPLMARSEQLTNHDDPGEERRRFEQGTPLGRYGTPEEIARSIAFLLSPEVPYLTGASLSVDGGLQAI